MQIENRTRVDERLDVPDLVRRYQAGESVQKLARERGVDRGIVRRRLVESGIQPRNRSASLKVRMGRMTPAEKKRLTAAAHRARRGAKISAAETGKRSVSRQRSLSHAAPAVLRFGRRLKKRGLAVIPEMAIGPYNLDLAIQSPPVAVEVYAARAASGLMLARHPKRTKYLLDRGWTVLIVWANPLRYPLGVATEEHIVAIAEEMRRRPSARGQYRVIRGDGQSPPACKSYLNDPALIERLRG